MSYEWWGVTGWHNRQMLQQGVRVASQPQVEPITLDDARQHLRLDTYGSPPAHEDDTIVAALLSAAREWCEGDLGLSLAPQTLELGRSAFSANPCLTVNYGTMSGSGYFIELPFGPVAGVVSVTYTDGDGIEQMLTSPDFVVDTYSRPARLFAAYGTSWPTIRSGSNAVRVRYLAGYSLPGDSPQDTDQLPWSLRAMILLVLGHLYEHRESSTELKLMDLPLGAKALGDRYRVRLGMA